MNISIKPELKVRIVKNENGEKKEIKQPETQKPK